MAIRLPHTGVYTRLKPSRIGGVGVFAIRRIPKGTFIFPLDNQRMRWVQDKQLKHLPREIVRLYKDFAIIRGKAYGAPWHFDRITPAWYLNHSKRPNVAIDGHFHFYALKDIPAGTELTVDYDTYSDRPQNGKHLQKLNGK